MTLHITDEATDRLVRLLAQKKGKTIEETVRAAITEQIERELKRRPSSKPLRAIRNALSAASKRTARRRIKRFEVSGSFSSKPNWPE